MKEITGYTAAILTTIAFIPQVVKIIRSKSAKDISLIMYLVFTTGVLLWLVYGIMLDSMPIIIANSITASLCTMIIYIKITAKY